MLRLDTDSRASEATDQDVLRELEVRYPQIYTRRKERKARQEALKLSKKSTNHSPRVHFDNEDDRSFGRDVRGRRHSECIMGNTGRMQTEPEILGKVNGVESLLSNQKSPYQRRNTSPAIDTLPSCKSDALKERLKSNAERLNDLLYHQSPFSGKDGSSTARENGQVGWNGADHVDRHRELKQDRRNSEGSLKILTNIQNGHLSKKDPSVNLLCQRIFNSQDKGERERNSDFIFNTAFQRSSDITEASRLHDVQMTQLTVMSPLQSPESQADSAIDMESASVQSEMSELRNGGQSSECTSDILPSCYNTESNGLRERENAELSTFGVKKHCKDNDVRNRPLPSLPNFVGDLAIRSLQSLHTDREQSSSEESSSPRSPGTPKSGSPLVSPCRVRLQGQTTPRKCGPMRADHSLCSSTSSIGHSDRELEDIHLRTLTSPNGALTSPNGALTSPNGTLPSQRSVDDTVEDALDDTDPSLQAPSASYSERIVAERYRKGKKQVYRVRTRTTSPLFGRATPVVTPQKSDSDVQSDRSILLDMRFSNSFDQSQYVSYVTENSVQSSQSESGSLKSKSLNDLFQNDVEKRLRLLLENGGPHYNSEVILNDTYSSSTDYPLYGDEHYVINDNFTLSPRSELNEQMTVTMDDIGESKTEDHLSDDSKDMSSLECSSLSEQSPVYSKVKTISGQEKSPKKYVSEITVFPKLFDDNKGIMKTVKDEHSESQTRNVGASRENSLTSDSDPSCSPRIKDTDTEFFMEAEFLDAAMKPKKSRFQKLFGGKKGRYSPSAQDMPPLSAGGHSRQVPRKQAVKTAAADLVLAQEHANQSQTDLVKEELGESVVDQMITGHLAQQSRNFKAEITNSGHLTQQSRNCNDVFTDTRHLKQQSKEVRVERTVKDVRFSVERTLDDTGIESYSGSLLREGRITPCESSVLRDRHEPADVISRDEKDGVYLASPVVISSGRGSCLDLGVSDDNIPQLDAVSDPDMSRVCMSGSSAQTDQSTPYMFDSVTSSEKPLVGCETSNTISHTTDTDVESSINTASHKTDVNVKLGSTISHTTDPDFITYNTASNTRDHDMSYFSEGFDHLETFDERFDGSFSVSGSDHLNNSLSARSIWSECKDLTEADNSFEDVFDGSFTPRSTESKEPSCQIKEEGDLKEEKEKSSGYGSENSRQTSETRDEPFSDEEKSNHSKVIVEIPRHPSVDLNDEDVDRIFEMAKDPPTFADVDDAMSFGELNTDYSVVLHSKGMNDIVEVAEPVAFQANSPIKVKSDSESGEICDESIVPQLSHQSPPMSKNKVPSRLCKGNSQMTSSTCSDDIEDITDAGSTASKLYESDEMGMSSESEAIRSAFDFLSSSSEVEALTSARDRLRILEEEDSGEDEDLASSIKILSDLRKSLLSENEDLLFEQGFIHEEVTEIEREDSKPPSPPTISEDDDSSFQVDPKPAGIHVEIQVDIHHPNVEDSDNGSEIDAPLDVLDEETMVGAGMLLLPENHVDDDDEATTPRPMEEDLDASINPFNRTFTVSADCNGDDVSIKSSNLATCGGLVRSSLADELKLPLWEKFPDLSSSEKSTPRGYESSTMEGSIPDSSFDVSYRSVELNSDVNKIVPSVSPKAVHKSETEKALDNPEMDEKGSLGLIKEAYSDRSSGGISQRYIKKSEMDRKKALLRRQKEVERDEVNDEGEVIEDDWESHGECVSEDMNTEELTLHAQNQRQTTHQSGNNFKELFEDSVDVVDGANRIDPVDNDVSESTVSSVCDIASSRSENSAPQAPEFIMGSEDVSPRHLTQTDLPEAEVSLSEEMDVSGSSGEVWFDDLNNKTLNERKGSLTSVLSPRADAYRKASDSCDSAKSDDSSSPTDLIENRYNLPDVVQSQGLQPESDNKLGDQVKVKTRRKENPYARISEDGSISDDSQEESFDLSLNSFISPYATTKSLAKISSTPKSHYKSKAAELSCDGIEPVYDPYATIDSPKGDNSDRRKSGGSDINPYATLNDVTAADLNDGVLHSSKDVLVEASGELSAQSSVDVGDRKSHGGMKIPEIRIEAPTEDEADEEDSKKGKCLDDLYAKVMKDRSKGDDPDTSKDETNLNSSTSQSSKGENSFTTPSEEELLGACGGCEELLDTNDEGPPLPSRRYERSISSESTLRSSKALSASKSSLFTNFKDTARVRFQTMRKAMSMDRGLDEVNHDEKNKSGKKEKGEKVKEKNKGEKEKKEKKKKSDGKMKKAPSLKSLSSLFGRKNRDRLSSVEGEGEENIDEPVKKGKKERGFFKSKKKRQISTPISTVDMPTHFRCIGKLKAVNPDGSQIIELSKPPDGPIGFYIAKGTVNYDYGIFVSRFTDDQQKLFAGILGVGDEILEVNDQSVQDKSLDDVYALMAETDKPIMKVFPIVARKEV